MLHLVEPHLNGPGGDLTRDHRHRGGPGSAGADGPGSGADGRDDRPLPADGLDLVPGAGGLAAAVPGAVDAWLLLLRDHGTGSWPTSGPTRCRYAENGLPTGRPRRHHHRVGPRSCSPGTGRPRPDFWLLDGRPRREHRADDQPRVRRGTPRAAERRAARPGPGRTRIEAARHEWRTGLVARAATELLARPHRHASGTDHAGGDHARGLRRRSGATWEPAMTADFRGYTLAKTGPWGQGPILLQALTILEGYPDAELDPSTEIGAHHLLEALKLALADRDAYYGDPDPGPMSVPARSRCCSRRRTRPSDAR